MDSVLEYVLDGLVEALELERELGVKTIEIDRSLLDPVSPQPVPVPIPAAAPVATPAVASAPPAASPAARVSVRSSSVGELVFVHDRPLSPGGVEMMSKIITALGRTAENAPVVVAPPLPSAKITVILGGRAMKRYFPDLKGGPGQWIRTADGREVLITYSPDYILRFGTVTPAVKALKQEMWRSLKAVKQRLSS